MPITSLDMYRKVPLDLLDGTKRGRVISLLALFTMTTLFLLETRDFFTKETSTLLSLDKSTDSRVRVHFNITMMDLSCDYAVVDVVSLLGTEQNVTQNVQKYRLDSSGVRARFASRNKMQKDIAIKDESVTESLAELHENGEDVVYLDETTLGHAVEENGFVFVAFSAEWCWHCKAMEPTWEALAELMTDVADGEEVAAAKKRGDAGAFEEDYGYRPEYTEDEYDEANRSLDMTALVAKVDCVEHKDYCTDKLGISALPSIRLYINGDTSTYREYNGDRTILDFTKFLADVEHEIDPSAGGRLHRSEEAARRMRELPVSHEWRKSRERDRARLRDDKYKWSETVHGAGCQIAGTLHLDRVPGNFHVKASSKTHSLLPTMTNVSHEVHHLAFGDSYSGKRFVREGNPQESVTPFDGNAYVTRHLHQAYHHHLKVVTTNFDYVYWATPFFDRSKMGVTYQILQQSQLANYHADDVPAAKFTYDLSPVAVTIMKRSKRWYDYFTSIMAIVGGSFTLFGLLESSIGLAISKKRR